MGKKDAAQFEAWNYRLSLQDTIFMEMHSNIKKYRQFIHKQVTFTGRAQNTSCMEYLLQGAWMYL